MFQNSLAVFKRITKDIKIGILIFTSICTSLFILFYTYLAVIHFNELFLFIPYAVLIGVEIITLITDIVSKTSIHNDKRVTRNVKLGIKVVSWLSRSIVIGYNIYYYLNNPISDLNKVILIGTGILIVVDIIVSLLGRFLIYYYETLIYSLYQDYIALYSNKDVDPSTLPFGIELKDLNNDRDYSSYNSKAYIEYQIASGIKLYSYNHHEDNLSKKDMKKLEAKFLKFYLYTKRHYSRDNILSLISSFDIDKEDKKVIILSFFVLNKYVERYVSIRDEALIIAYMALELYKIENDLMHLEMLYNSVIPSVLLISDTLGRELREDKDKKNDLLAKYANKMIVYLDVIKEEDSNSSSFSSEIKHIVMDKVKDGAKQAIKETADKINVVKKIFRKK